MTFAPEDLHATDDPNCVHNCQNGKNRPSRATVQGRKTWRSCRAKPGFTILDIPSGPMPWVMACCHTGCLLFIEGMNTRMGQKAACGARGGIMERTKS